MQRQVGTQASSIVIFLSVLSILIQFAVYDFFGLIIVIWGISFLTSLISCHILFEKTSTYRICFDYSFLNVFISLLIIILTYSSDTHTILPYSDAMLGIAAINWLAPMLYSFIRNMFSPAIKSDEFNSFYRDSSILFLIFYLALLIYGLFFKNAFPWAYKAGTATGFSPFVIITDQIEACIDGSIPLSDILIYLSSRILIFIPFGFYVRLLFRKWLVKLIALIVFPLVIEGLQFLIIPERCVIDDVVYGLVGGFLGIFIYFILDLIYHAISGRSFLMNASDHRGRSLHF